MTVTANPERSVHPGGLAAAGGSAGDDDGDDPSGHKRLKHNNNIDANPVFPEDDDDEEADDGAGKKPPAPPRRPPRRPEAAGPRQCDICNKIFSSINALHGHMRSHPFRKLHGSATLSGGKLDAEQEVVDSLLLLSGQGGATRKRRFICSRCNREFATRQALGGHRASHKSQKGCFEKARELREYGPRSGRRRRKRGINSEGPSGTKNAEAAAVTFPVTAPPAAPRAATRAVERTTTTVRRGRKRKLDLNLLPASSDDTSGGNGNGNGNGSPTSGAKG
ncbi:hypothetical protein MUK42_00065 [Musa troglodytarum]|uniref:C2H2-type domain-containing protein n=1 Tax=Musa troglodytarum TaxID=320322 RepID=A0A9E7FH00_9LILI|nr:hypothetical protein MUK42_00065 [Musa troglodytarum]